MLVGQRISYLRSREGTTQAALARAINTTRASVNAWEQGISNPNMESLIDLSSYFHVSIDYLLGLESTEMISLDNLKPEEREMVMRLIHYFDTLHDSD